MCYNKISFGGYNMLINDTKVEFSVEERRLIKKFFDESNEYLKNTDLYNYENLKVFGEMYQKFLEENNQTKNDKLLLFLVEIKYNQLSFKITKDSLNEKITNQSKNKIPNFIRLWFMEGRILLYKSEIDIENKKLQLDQNVRELEKVLKKHKIIK